MRADQKPSKLPSLTALDLGDLTLLHALRHEAKGRADLATDTGWSRNTVATKLAGLIDEGWIVEIDGNQGDRGRPFVRYRLNPSAALVFIARFDAHRIGAAICRLDGEVLAWESNELPAEPGPEGAIQLLDDLLARMSAKKGLDREHIRAMVVGVPGPVSDMSRTVPWSKVGVLPSHLADHFSMKVAVENDANIMAIGTKLENPDANSLMFLLVETGIGAGLIFSGELHRGLLGWAGEVGHIPIAAAGETPCICGNRGCLAIVAANPALMRQMSTPARPVETVDDLRALVLAGDLDAIMALRQAGRHIGEAIAGLVIGLALELIAVGGSVAQIDNHVIAGIRETLAQKLPPGISSQIRIIANADHNRNGIRGATDLAFDLLLPKPGARPF